MSRILYDERPLVVNPELAHIIGLNESIILHQIHYWVRINEKAEQNLHDGYYWTYNTYEAWREQFPFWSRNTIIRVIKRLESRGFLISGNYNKMPQDKTKWYRIDYEALPILSSQSTQDEQSIKPKRVASKPKLGKPLPETNTENTPKTNSENDKAEPSPVTVVFEAILAHYSYPDDGGPDPIPNRAKEGMFIKKMIGRGFTPVEIIGCWLAKTKKRGQYCSMVYINEDIRVKASGDPDKYIKGKYGHMVRR